MSRRVLLTLGLVLIFLLVFGSASYAADADSPWRLDLYMNIWGLGLSAAYDGLTLIPGAETDLYGSLCATYEDWGFYRNPDGTPYIPGGGTDLGVYKRMDYVWSMGAIQELALGDYPFEAFLFYKGQYDTNIPGASPAGSLIFASGLPDAEGIQQHSLLVGAAYDNMTADAERWTKRGYRAEVSLEWAPGALNETADFTCLNATIIGFWPLIEGDGLDVYLGNRLIYDKLAGEYIPVGARTGFGGLREFPGRQVPGLGDGLRGVQLGRFDGYVKVLNNLEVRLTLPGLLGELFTPGAVAYYDLGLSDEGTGTLDWGNPHSAAGIGLALHTWMDLDLVAYGNYYFNEDRFTAGMTMGLHF